ncbi:procathepsin L-like [Zophobas morio]|uniref:procathepsin L-like n=1 Tax=Zophobas morio TaxID=2755281 RepID=UPI003082A1F1
MKFFLILIAVFMPSFSNPMKEEVQRRWNDYKTLYQKSYDDSEEQKRFDIFETNLRTIEDHNKQYGDKKVSYKMAVNQFADLTCDEFAQYYARGYKPRNTESKVIPKTKSIYDEVPEEIDWREKGAVTQVKNQGVCGACWAFSTTGSLEGQNFLKNGVLVSLSEQELVDCIIARSLRGCNGGFLDVAFQYVIDHGLSTEDDYPYEEADGICHRGDLPSAVTEIAYLAIFGTSEEALKDAVGTVGPISVGVDATKWQFYSEGVFYDATCKTEANSLNHAVLAVGYGTEDDGEYWLVKNSYGPEWGMDGYIKLARNRNNTCGIATEPWYPVL